MVVIATGDFETGDRSQWSTQSADDATRLVVVTGSEAGFGGPTGPFQGTYYLRTVTKNGDNVLGGERAEVLGGNFAGAGGGGANGVSVWSLWAIYIASDTPANFAHGELHGQWHSGGSGTNQGQANVQNGIMKGSSSFDTIQGITSTEPWMTIGINGGAGGPYQQVDAPTSKVHPYIPLKHLLGKWIKYLWHINWGDGTSGNPPLTELWIDDGDGWIKVLEETVVPNLYSPNVGSYLKEGTNRIQSSGLPDRYVWLDATKSGTTRADVDPGHSPVGCWVRGIVDTGGKGDGMGGSGTSMVVKKPMDTQSGDVMYIGIANDGAVITPASGWTLIKSQAGAPQTISVYRKIAGAGEPATYTFTQASAQAWTYQGIAVSGADQTTPETANAGVTGTAGASTINAPAITGTQNGVLLDFFCQGNKTQFSHATAKLHWKGLVDTGVDANGRTFASARQKIASTGTIAARTVTDLNPNAVGTLDTMAAVSITVAPASTGQFARPASDVTAGNWVPSTGGSLFATIDESVADDADYDRSPMSPPTASIMEVKLGSLTDPNVSTGHVVRYRISKDQAGGDRIDMTVRLVQGTTVIASWTHNDIPATPQTFEQTLTTTQTDSITDYTNLRLRFEAVKV